MRNLSLRLLIGLLTFAVGIAFGVLWQSYRSHKDDQSQKQVAEPPSHVSQEEEWELTPELVSRALQTRVITTKQLRRNSGDEVVWRWLKQSIAEYPQNFVKLNISESEHYGVIIYKAETLTESEMTHYNRELKSRGLPLLEEGKAYGRLQVTQSNIICPSWIGLVDLEKAKLVYFAGHSA